MKLNNNNFPLIVNDLYNSDEYNKIISELAYTKNKGKYGLLILQLFRVQQSVLDDYENLMK